MTHGGTPDVMDRCAHTCHECHDECLDTMMHCLELGGEHASRDHQALLQDCAEICQTAENFLHRGSRHAAHVCRECAEICRECADDCERIASGDQLMLVCAKACRHCAVECERMTAA